MLLNFQKGNKKANQQAVYIHKRTGVRQKTDFLSECQKSENKWKKKEANLMQEAGQCRKGSVREGIWGDGRETKEREENLSGSHEE